MSPTGSGPAQPLDVTRRGTALITGASSGLGTEFAWQLAAAGHDLVIVARREERLAQLKNELEQVAGISVEVIVADLATADGRAQVVERLRDESAPIGLLVNNAGFGLGQRFIGGSLERENEAIEVMIRAVMELSHAAATAMIPRGRGAILNVSSMVAQTAMGTYAAAKAWVKTFTEALAGELEGTGVTATAVSPGLVRTEFHSASGMKESAWPEFGWLDAEDVVADALAAVRRGAVHTTPSLRYKSLQGIMKLAPRALVRKIGGPKMWERAIPDESATVSLADLYDELDREMTDEERALLSRIQPVHPVAGQWLQDAIGSRFGLAPADLLGAGFDRYVQVRFAITKEWTNDDEAGEPTYQRWGLNPSQWKALGEHLRAAPGPLTVGLWEGYSGFTNRGSTGYARAIAWDPAPTAEEAAEVAEWRRLYALHELPKAVSDGDKLHLPYRDHILMQFESWGDLEEYFDWNTSAQLPNLMWPKDHRWATAIEVDGGSVVIGCDAALADELISDERLYAESIDPDTQALGCTDEGDPQRDPLVEEDDLD